MNRREARAVREMSPRPSEGASRVICPAAQALAALDFELDFDFDLDRWPKAEDHKAEGRGLRHNDHRTPRVAGEPARDGPDEVVPEVSRRPNDECIRAELASDRGQFTSRATPPGADVDLEPGGVRRLVEFRQ